MGGNQHHWPAPPCPMCGKEDAARMGSTRWGHDWSCCSNECGFAFANSEERRKREHARAMHALAAAQAEVDRWAPREEPRTSNTEGK